jgi:hypothetical protein
MRYEVWTAIPDMGTIPDQKIVEAPDAETAILRVGVGMGEDFGDQAENAIVVEVRDADARLAE